MTDDMITTTRPEAANRAGWRLWNLAAVAGLTCYSAGISWQGQLVSYPLYRAVPADGFLAYHQAYNEAIPLVVVVPGFACFLAGMAFPWTRPRAVPRWAAALVALSGLGSTLVTVLWAIPRHDTLDVIGRDAATIDSLLHANAWRTAALTVGAGVLLWSLVRTTTARPGWSR